jgi:hypothetical protein
VSHFEAGVSPAGHGGVTGVSGGGHDAKSPAMTRAEGDFSGKSAKNAYKGAEASGTPQTPVVVVPMPRSPTATATAKWRAAHGPHNQNRKPQAAPKTPMELLMREHLESLRVRGYSEFTVKNRLVHIGFFIEWAYEHGCANPSRSRGPCSNAISGTCSSTARRTGSR